MKKWGWLWQTESDFVGFGAWSTVEPGALVSRDDPRVAQIGASQGVEFISFAGALMVFWHWGNPRRTTCRACVRG